MLSERESTAFLFFLQLTLKDQSIAMAKAEDEKRKEVADHFQSSIADIQQQLTEYLAKNNDLRQENRSLADKLQSFIKDHEKREEHVQKVGRMWSSFLIFLNPWSWFPLFIFAPQILKTRELEVRLAEAKLSQAKVQQEQEGLKFKQEISRLNEESTLMGKRMAAHKTVEERLREQVRMSEKYYQGMAFIPIKL